MPKFDIKSEFMTLKSDYVVTNKTPAVSVAVFPLNKMLLTVRLPAASNLITPPRYAMLLII